MGHKSQLKAQRRNEKIAQVQRERDIAEVAPHWLPLIPDWDDKPVIKLDPAQPLFPGLDLVLKLEDNNNISSTYRDDISTPFSNFYILCFPYFVHIRQSEIDGSGTYDVTMLFFDLALPLGLTIKYKTNEIGERLFQSAHAGDDFYTEFHGDDVDDRRAGLDIIDAILRMMFGVSKVLTASNIELVDQPPNPRLSAISEREFGRPLTTYKVLKVNTGHKEYRGQDANTGLKDFDPRRMHVVRGHHAEYGTNGRKLLFGKYERKIWIPAHVRGNEERGIVVKDYEVVNHA